MNLMNDSDWNPCFCFNRGHTVSRVPSALLVKKANEVLEVTPAQLVLRAQWEKGYV